MVSHPGKTTGARRFTSYHSVTTKHTNDHSRLPNMAISLRRAIRHCAISNLGCTYQPAKQAGNRCRNVSAMLA